MHTEPCSRIRLLAISLLWLSPIWSAAQTQPRTAAGVDLFERISPSVALILVGEGNKVQRQGTGLNVQPSGVLLTAYHVVKDAQAVQVQFKNGETFDRVELLAFDDRRDVAALRITGTGLPTLPVAALADARAGQEVYVVSNAGSLSWTASSGILSGVRTADEVPGAGHGYRLLQFTAPISPGSSGGVLTDAQGRALGIIVGTASGGQNLNFAVPIESVLGLAQASGGTLFAPGSQLQKASREPTPPPAAPVRAPKRTAEVFSDPAQGPEIQPINPGGAELSNPIESRDPIHLMRDFRTIYIISRTVWLKLDLMQQALQRQPALGAWGVALVADPKVADVRLTVDRVLFTWTWTYEMVHQNTGIVLASGKLNATAGGSAADHIAQVLVQRIAESRGMPAGMPAPQKP